MKSADYYIELERRFNKIEQPYLTDEEVKELYDFHSLIGAYSSKTNDCSTAAYHRNIALTYWNVYYARTEKML